MDTEKNRDDKNINDEILKVVKGFIDYFEEVEEKMEEVEKR